MALSGKQICPWAGRKETRRKRLEKRRRSRPAVLLKRRILGEERRGEERRGEVPFSWRTPFCRRLVFRFLFQGKTLIPCVSPIVKSFFLTFPPFLLGHFSRLQLHTDGGPGKRPVFSKLGGACWTVPGVTGPDRRSGPVTPRVNPTFLEILSRKTFPVIGLRPWCDSVFCLQCQSDSQ